MSRGVSTAENICLRSVNFPPFLLSSKMWNDEMRKLELWKASGPTYPSIFYAGKNLNLWAEGQGWYMTTMIIAMAATIYW